MDLFNASDYLVDRRIRGSDEPFEDLELCRPRLAGFKRPKRIVLVEVLPRTVTGKIQRSQVRELAADPLALASR